MPDTRKESQFYSSFLAKDIESTGRIEGKMRRPRQEGAMPALLSDIPVSHALLCGACFSIYQGARSIALLDEKTAHLNDS